MRLGRLVTAVTLLITLGLIGGTGPSAMAQTAPPPGAISDNVEFIANITEMRQAIAVNFIGNTMFVSTVHGVYSYDITNPATPTLLGALPMFIWENEDMSEMRCGSGCTSAGTHEDSSPRPAAAGTSRMEASTSSTSPTRP